MKYNSLFIEHKKAKVLSKEQIYKYIESYRSGDYEAKEIVITHNIGLVLNAVLNRFSNTHYDKDELVAVGMIGLVKSVNNFDPSKNFEFATYASTCIDNEIRQFMRKGNKYINDCSFEETILGDGKGNALKLEDTIMDDKIDIIADYENKEIAIEIRKIVESLDEKDKKIIMLYFGFYDNIEYKQREIADMLGISQSYISRIIKDVLRKIEKELLQQGLVELKGNTKKLKRL